MQPHGHAPGQREAVTAGCVVQNVAFGERVAGVVEVAQGGAAQGSRRVGEVGIVEHRAGPGDGRPAALDRQEPARAREQPPHA
ncbi:MAG: hypothetical protein ACK559_07070, partial [bacterium]